MSKVWVLTKVLLKTSFLSGTGTSRKKRNKILGFIGVGILFLFVIGSLGLPIIIGLDALLSVVPMHNIVLSLVLPFAGVTTVVFSLFSIINVFYKSKDVEYLLPLPLKAKDILLAKFFVSLISEYYILFMFIFPFLIGVGIGIDAGVLYYVYTCLVFVLLPIIPSVIVTFVILLITKVKGVGKNKDLFAYVSMAIILLFAFVYNYFIQNVISVDVENIGSTLQTLEKMILPYCRLIFPFYNSAVTSLVSYNSLNGLFAFIVFVGINFVFVGLLYWLADGLYLKSLTVTRGSKNNKVEVEKVINNRSVGSFGWLLRKEWLIIKRSPVFMLNIVIVVFLVPIILVISLLFAFVEEGVIVSFNSELINAYLSNPVVYLIVLVVFLFFTSTSSAASTSISREGGSAWFMKIIPVSYFKQVNVKVFFATIIDMVSILFIGVILFILYKIPFYYFLSVLIPVFCIVVLLNYFSIYIDLKNPKLKWDEESVAVKQNLNGLFSTLLCMVVCVIFGIIAFVFYFYNLKMNVVLLSVIISVVSSLVLILVVFMFYKNNDRLLDNVD